MKLNKEITRVLHLLNFRAEVIERGSVLRTKAMKEAESQRALRRYRYALIRVRFPDGVLLQGKTVRQTVQKMKGAFIFDIGFGL